MIDELRFYRIAAGGLAEYLKHAGEVAVPFRGDRYGKLLGFWYAEIGAANCVFNLWQHVDLNTREALRAELQQQEVWRQEYLPHSQPLMREQSVRLMKAVMPLRSAPPGRNVYEFRFLRTPVGKAQELAVRMQTELPPSVLASTLAIWSTFLGRLNEVVHLCAYGDVQTRLVSSQLSPEWQRFLAQHGALIDTIDSSLLLPASFSPLQ